MFQLTCNLCKKQFQIPNKRKNTAKFCSKSCRAKIICQISIKNGWTFKNRHHDQSSRKKIAESLIGKTGKFARNWKGGISRAYKTGYYSPKYKEWRNNVFIRDKYTCQECRITGNESYLTAHHIKSFAYYPKSRFSISNGVTLCESCHSKTDNYKRRTNKLKRAKKLS